MKVCGEALRGIEWLRRIAPRVCAALLLVCTSTFSLAAQEPVDGQRSSWFVGGSIGVPGYALNPEPQLFTIAGHGTQVQPGRLGADIFMGIMPRLLMSDGFVVGARGGVVLPVALSEKILLLPSGGASFIGELSSGGLSKGLNVGVATLIHKESSLGFRAGITWHRFQNFSDAVWLMEFGLVRRR